MNSEITDEQRQDLYRLYRYYWKESLRCEESRAYLAGSVMLETSLMLMVNCYPDEAEKANTLPIYKNKHLLKWSLKDFYL